MRIDLKFTVQGTSKKQLQEIDEEIKATSPGMSLNQNTPIIFLQEREPREIRV